MLRLILLVSLFFVFYKASLAQNPGYLGLHNTAQFNYNFSPVWVGPSASNAGMVNVYGEQKKRVAINSTIGLGFYHTLSKSFSWAVEYDAFRTGMIANYRSASGVAGYYDEHYCFQQLNVNRISTGFHYFSYYKRGAISPYGMYGGLLLGVNFIDAKILDRKTTYPSLSDGTLNSFNLSQNLITYHLKLEIGMNYIFRDRFLFNVSMNTRVLNYNLSEMRSTMNANQMEFDTKATSRMAAHDKLNTKIGFGYLLF